MNIRKMTMADYGAVYDLWENDGNVGLRSLDDSEEGIRKFLLRNPDTNFTAVEDKSIVGAVLCGNDGRRAYIYHLFVSPGFRRMGIAKKLVDFVLESLDKIGITKAGLTIYTTNGNGNAFWDSIGFIKRDDLYYRNKSLNDMNK